MASPSVLYSNFFGKASWLSGASTRVLAKCFSSGGHQAMMTGHAKDGASALDGIENHQAIETPTIVSVQQETRNVKRFTFEVASGSEMTFLAGQWVDLFPPASSGLDSIGGYSFASTPHRLQSTGTFQLLIKSSRHPVAQWMHHEARVGTKVMVRPGGDFFIRDAHLDSPLLFLAGGIGIAPLYSMMAHAVEARQGLQHNTGHTPIIAAAPPPRMLVIYSTKCCADFVLNEELAALAHGSGQQHLQVWDAVTSGSADNAGETNASARARESQDGDGAPSSPLLLAPHGSSRRFLRRLCESDMQEALQWLQGGPEQAHHRHHSSGAVQDQKPAAISSRRPLAFLCGPPAFADGCAAHLAACGLSPKQIIYERWW